MKSKLKALGLALVAVFAMSAVMATAAQATQAQFTAAEYPAVGTGHIEGAVTANYFQITGAGGEKIHCSTVTYEATLAAASTKLTVTPHYNGCTTGSGVGSTVDLNGCDYVFVAGTKTSTVDSHGSVEIVCPAGNSIQVTSGGICTTDIGPQTITSGITYTNVGNGDVTVDVDITGKIKYTETDQNFFCPNTNGHVTSDGNFVSNVLLTGFKDLGTQASPVTTGASQVKEGAAVNIDVG
jgi:hypothetical protein